MPFSGIAQKKCPAFQVETPGLKIFEAGLACLLSGLEDYPSVTGFGFGFGITIGS